MAIFFIIYTIIYVSQGVQLWYDPFDSPNGYHLNWTMDFANGMGSIADPYTSNVAECPLNNYCWQFSLSSSAFYVSQTTGFENISITYSVTGAGLEPLAGDQCEIFYSINSTTLWTSADITTSNTPSTKTVSLPQSTYNDASIGIKIASIAYKKNKFDIDDCLFQDISLNGDAINAITSASPTQTDITSIPSKAPTKSTSSEPTAAPSKNPSTSTQATQAPSNSKTNDSTTFASTSHSTTFASTAQHFASDTVANNTHASTEPSESILVTNISIILVTNTSITNVETTANDVDTSSVEEELGLLDEILNKSGDMMPFGIYGLAGCAALFLIVLIICCCCCYCCCCKKKGKSKDAAASTSELYKHKKPQAVEVPALSPEVSLNDDHTTNQADFPDIGVDPVMHEVIEVDKPARELDDTEKYDPKGIEERAQHTNALPDDFWVEESESFEKNEVVNRWQRAMSNVRDSESKVIKGSKTAPFADVPPPPKTPPDEEQAANVMQQVMGYDGGKDEDSSDESIMRKQREFQGNYNPNAPAVEDESESSSIGDMLTLTEPIRILDIEDEQKQNKKFVITIHNEDGTKVEAKTSDNQTNLD